MVKVTAYKQEYKEKIINCQQDERGEEFTKSLLSVLENIESTPEINVLVALDENENCVGYAKTTLLTKGFMSLDDIYVIPSERRTGTGSVIVVAVLQLAVRKYVVNLMAKCDATNTAALALFKKTAFLRGNDLDGTAYFTKSLIHMYR